ncbi:MAG: glycosyltransferase [Oscillospiraceae bacterium]|nr:glycosyltransferase [Oscillospiraceae bacterium]
MNPKLSIIVPVYNVCAFLEKCIKSILAQTFKDFELILVDDGSTDGSGEICDKFADIDNRIKVIHKQNGGVVSARKAGLRQASGKYAGYVDGDDWIDHDMYEKMTYYMDKFNCDLVMCDVAHESKSLPLSSGSTCVDIDAGYYDYENLKEKILPKMLYAGDFYTFGIYPVIWNKLYKREKLIEHQMEIDENIKTGEDAACVYPYLLSCESLYFIKDLSLYHYRQSQNQMTAAYDDMYFERFKSLYSFFSGSKMASSPYSDQLYYYYAYLIKTTISNELKKENTIPFSKKLRNIKEICEFTNREAFLAKVDISALHHKLYFALLKLNKPLLLVAGISITRFIQRILK